VKFMQFVSIHLVFYLEFTKCFRKSCPSLEQLVVDINFNKHHFLFLVNVMTRPVCTIRILIIFIDWCVTELLTNLK
jgi:hypothetical protein